MSPKVGKNVTPIYYLFIYYFMCLGILFLNRRYWSE